MREGRQTDLRTSRDRETDLELSWANKGLTATEAVSTSWEKHTLSESLSKRADSGEASKNLLKGSSWTASLTGTTTSSGIQGSTCIHPPIFVSDSRPARPLPAEVSLTRHARNIHLVRHLCRCGQNIRRLVGTWIPSSQVCASPSGDKNGAAGLYGGTDPSLGLRC